MDCIAASWASRGARHGWNTFFNILGRGPLGRMRARLHCYDSDDLGVRRFAHNQQG